MELEQIKNPFLLFPLEVWETIVDRIEDSKFIINVLRGFPQLDIGWTPPPHQIVPFYSPKRFWYIDQILPYLCYSKIGLSRQDFLNLRLVCKQWSLRVDHFLQNQPYDRAYSEDHDKDRSFEFFEQSEWGSGLGPSLLVRTYADSQRSRISKKIDEIMEHPPARNPFVSREISVDTGGWNNALEKELLLKLIPGFERFGTHLWYLNFRVVSHATTFEMNVFFQLLRHTPNLKSLNLDMDLEDSALNELNLLSRFLPELPFLETIKTSYKTSSSWQFVKVLLERYGNQIRKFSMQLDSGGFNEIENLLPQLTELELDVWIEVDEPNEADFGGFETLKKILSKIASPNLVKLLLRFSSMGVILPLSVEENILEWLKRFPKIKYLEIQQDNLQEPYDTMINMKEEDTSVPIKDSIPSLETLKLPGGHRLSYKFLRCFPSLRHLEIQPFSMPTVVDLSVPDPLKLREQFQTAKLYESNLWDVLPKLQTVALCSEYGSDYNIWFSRETLESLRKAGRIPTETLLHPYREDILIFIENNI